MKAIYEDAKNYTEQLRRLNTLLRETEAEGVERCKKIRDGILQKEKHEGFYTDFELEYTIELYNSSIEREVVYDRQAKRSILVTDSKMLDCKSEGVRTYEQSFFVDSKRAEEDDELTVELINNEKYFNHRGIDLGSDTMCRPMYHYMNIGLTVEDFIGIDTVWLDINVKYQKQINLNTK